jgi:hypothetical protein
VICAADLKVVYLAPACNDVSMKLLMSISRLVTIADVFMVNLKNAHISYATNYTPASEFFESGNSSFPIMTPAGFSYAFGMCFFPVLAALQTFLAM